MHFLLAAVALVACYACWRYCWSDPAFKPYLAVQNPQYGPKGIYVFWASIVIAAWGLLINDGVPSSLSLLISVTTAVVWLSSPAGMKFMKDLV